MVQGIYNRLIYKFETPMREALGSYNWETKGDGKAKGCLQGNKRGKSPGTTTDTAEGSNSDNRMMEVLM